MKYFFLIIFILISSYVFSLEPNLLSYIDTNNFRAISEEFNTNYTKYKNPQNIQDSVYVYAIRKRNIPLLLLSLSHRLLPFYYDNNKLFPIYKIAVENNDSEIFEILLKNNISFMPSEEFYTYDISRHIMIDGNIPLLELLIRYNKITFFPFHSETNYYMNSGGFLKDTGGANTTYTYNIIDVALLSGNIKTLEYFLNIGFNPNSLSFISPIPSPCTIICTPLDTLSRIESKLLTWSNVDYSSINKMKKLLIDKGGLPFTEYIKTKEGIKSVQSSITNVSKYYINNTRVRLRSEPNTSSKVIKELNTYEPVIVVSVFTPPEYNATKDNENYVFWLQCLLVNGETGWIYSDYLTVLKR